MMVCGHGVREGTGLCDGNDLGMSTCVTLGRQIGLLECNPMIWVYDSSMCPTPMPGGGAGDGG